MSVSPIELPAAQRCRQPSFVKFVLLLLTLSTLDSAGAQQPSWSTEHRAATNAFVIAYRAVQRGAGDTSFSATALSPREPDSDWYARAARALDVARAAFGSANRPYNAMVVPASDQGDWFVYLVPAPTQPGVFPLGGDARYRVSPDGRTLIARRRLHNTVLQYTGRTKPNASQVAAFHTAVLDDRPEDTDVFHVLSREPKLPEYIASQSYFFRVDLDGRITAYRQERSGN